MKEIDRVKCFREVQIPKSIQITEARSLKSEYIISLARDALQTVRPMREELIVTRMEDQLSFKHLNCTQILKDELFY